MAEGEKASSSHSSESKTPSVHRESTEQPSSTSVLPDPPASEQGAKQKDQTTVLDIDDPLLGAENSTFTGLAWKDIVYRIPVGKKKDKNYRTILSGLSGEVRPGEVVGIIGSSGAGKTSLINILAGRVTGGEISGEVLYNGQKRIPRMFKQKMAYVEQDDLLYPHFSVQETIEFATKLRLSSKKYTLEQKKKRTADVIHLLRLDEAKDTYIGNALTRGVSGGERKRVSIGIELVTEPDILFLDEPTSGLDSNSALNVVETLVEIAQSQRIGVLMTIHQPSAKLLFKFHKLILIAKGKQVYSGPVADSVGYFANIGYPCPSHENPADYYIDLMTVDTASAARKEASEARIKELQDAWENESGEKTPKDPHFHRSSPPITATGLKAKARDYLFDPYRKRPISWIHELAIVVRRSGLDNLRNKIRVFAGFGQSIFLGLVIGFSFFSLDTSQSSIQNRAGLLFFIPINLTFGNIMPFLGLFSLQRAIMMRERASRTYRVSSFYLSKAVTELPFAWFFMTIFTTLVYFIAKLQLDPGKFFIYLGICALHVFAALSFGFVIGSAVATVQMGQIIAPTVLTLFLIFGGLFLNNDDIPKPFIWIKYISFVTYSYQALMQNEFRGLTFDCGTTNAARCLSDGEAVLKQFQVEEFTIAECAIINFCLGVGFQILGYLFLRLRSKLRGIWI